MIVSDSTTLIILSDLNRFNLLSNLFENIIIPYSVYKEINAKKPFILPSFIQIQRVKESETLKILKLLLDVGESEAIALALELKLKLIIDEKKGRKIAMKQGLEIIGLLGIVYLNVKKKYMTQAKAKDFLNEALKHGYRINLKLIESMFLKL